MLLIINSTISFIEENNAGNAAAALMAGLAPKTKVCVFLIFGHFFPLYMDIYIIGEIDLLGWRFVGFER